MNTRFTDAEVLQRCLTFMADLNGMMWENIEPDNYGRLDLAQRARALHTMLANQVHGKLRIEYKPESIDYIRAFTVDLYMGVVYEHPEGYAVQVKDLYANRWLTAGPTIWPKTMLNQAIKDAADRVGYPNPNVDTKK